MADDIYADPNPRPDDIPQDTADAVADAVEPPAQPTQVRRPWRATVRTTFQALLALAVMAPVLVQTTGLDQDQLPWLAGVLAVAAATTRVMALPQVEDFISRFIPFLSATPKEK